MVARRRECHARAVEPHTIFRRLQFYETGVNDQWNRRTVSLNGLRSGPRRGTGRAYSVVMLKKLENMNPQNDAGLVVVVPALDFKTEVLEANLPVLVEFLTPWSRPCQILDSVLQELARELAGKIKAAKVNADDSLDLSLCYDIQSVPTLLYFVEGIPRLRIVGTATKNAILAKLRASGFADSIDTLVKEASGAVAASSKGGLI